MSKSFPLFRFAGLNFTASPTALAGLAILWALLAGVGFALLRMPLPTAIAAGLACALLHFLSEIWHQLGHATAARQTGHPMQGVHFWTVLGASRYPRDEGELPGRVHVRRALGGPFGSTLLTMAAAGLAWLTPPGSTLGWVTLFLFTDNLLVFTLGAFLPLGFTDGSTLLRWWGKP